MKEIGADILRDTGCQVGMHTWQWTGGKVWRDGDYKNEPLDQSLPCLCRLYTWKEMKDANASSREAADPDANEPNA